MTPRKSAAIFDEESRIFGLLSQTGDNAFRPLVNKRNRDLTPTMSQRREFSSLYATSFNG
jgi:hypothetical protein